MFLASEGSLAQEHPIEKQGADELQAVSLVVPVPEDLLQDTPVNILVPPRTTDWHEVSVHESNDVVKSPPHFDTTVLANKGKSSSQHLSSLRCAA